MGRIINYFTSSYGQCRSVLNVKVEAIGNSYRRWSVNVTMQHLSEKWHPATDALLVLIALPAWIEYHLMPLDNSNLVDCESYKRLATKTSTPLPTNCFTIYLTCYYIQHHRFGKDFFANVLKLCKTTFECQ